MEEFIDRMKIAIEDIKLYCVLVPRAFVWCIRLKKIDPFAKDETVFEWIARIDKMEEDWRTLYIKVLADLYIEKKVGNHRKKLWNKFNESF